MKYCAQCGTGMEDNAEFCPQCGTQAKDVESEATNTPENSTSSDGKDKSAPTDSTPAKEAAAATPQAAPTATPMSQSSTSSKASITTLIKDHKPIAVGAGIAVIVIAILIIVFMMMGRGVSEDQLRQDLNSNSSLVTSGLTASGYVNDSPYEITELHITKQEQESGEIFGTTVEANVVHFTGTIENENFRTEFTSEAAYITGDNNEWQLLVNPSFETFTTTPLKGVDRITEQDTSQQETNYTTSDFNASFDEADGRYTSTASQTVTYDQWFATDTAKNTQVFVFDNQKGWQPEGEVQVSDEKTTWKLSDKTFEMEPSTSSAASAIQKSSVVSFTFQNSDSDETLSANYSIAFTAPESTKKYETLNDVNLTGVATGTPTHNFGSDSFSVELNDPEGNTTITCSTSSATLSAGKGTRNALSANIATQSIWRAWTGTLPTEYKYELTNAVFAENTSAA